MKKQEIFWCGTGRHEHSTKELAAACDFERARTTNRQGNPGVGREMGLLSNELALATALLNKRTEERDRLAQALEACRGMVEWARDNGAHFGATSALLKMAEAALGQGDGPDRREVERRLSIERRGNDRREA